MDEGQIVDDLVVPSFVDQLRIIEMPHLVTFHIIFVNCGIYDENDQCLDGRYFVPLITPVR